MFENCQFSNFELLRILSEEEQEVISAGQNVNNLNEINFFLQQTNMETEGENNLTLASGDISTQKTKYNTSQITIGTSIKHGIPTGSSISNGLSNFITNLISSLF